MSEQASILPILDYPEEVLQAFWSHVQICVHGHPCRDCCWLWKGRHSRYPGNLRVRLSDGTVVQFGVPRVSLEIALGHKLGTALACHTCDNPPCCNPAHLYAGTHKTNADDCTARDRRPRQRRVVSRVVPRYAPVPPIPPPPPPDFYGIGRRIAGRRTEHSLRQQDVAKAVGAQAWRLHRIEQGTVTKLDVPLLRAIADVLHVQVGYLLSGKTPKLT